MSRPSASGGDGDPLHFSVPDIIDADVAAVERVLRSGWLTTGDECSLLEEELSAYLGVDHVVGVASCTAALEICFAHLALPRGTPVGVPTWTFASTALAAHHQGLRPVLLDVEPDTLNLSAEALGRAIDAGLGAVAGVHFGGVPLSEEIHRLCAEAGLPLVEDAAHALGARDHRGPVAGQGTAGACFSFYATKNLTSGEGGAIATDDPELARFARSYRLHGMSRDAWARYRPDGPGGYDVIAPGIKANLPDTLAVLARSQLARFDALQARRRELVMRYRRALATIDGIRVVPAEPAAGSADHLLVILLPAGADRQVLRKGLHEAGIMTSVHFQPLSEFSWFEDEGIERGPGGTPVADSLADRALSLPLHTRLTDADVDRVCRALAAGLDW